jgi:hypothetical protein
VVFQELNHAAVEQPRLLHLAGMARAMKNPHRIIRNLLLQRECRLVDSILAAAQDDGRTLHARIVIRSVRRLKGQELADNRLEVGVRVALGEHVGEVHRQRRLAKRRAQVLEGVIPAIADDPVCVLLDAMPRELPAGVVTGAAHDQRFGLARPRVVHIGENGGADGAAD